jgi:outer membrane protein assembly factor BamB/tetratricopeptide (TPR) repeat protein
MARHNLLYRVLISIAVLVWVSVNNYPVLAADEDVKGESVEKTDVQPFGWEFVEQLGSDEFTVRQAAEESLVKEGKKCSAALNQALLNSSDLHIKRRCRWLLDLIVDREFDAQIKAFKAGEDIETLNFPTWSTFRERYGNDKDSADLFVEMVTAERPLLESYAAGPEVAAKALVFRISQIRSRMYVGNAKDRKRPELPTVAALAYVCSDLKIVLSPTDFSMMYSVLMLPEAKDRIKKAKPGSPIRRLFGEMLLAGDIPRVAQNYLTLASQLELKEPGCRLALRIINDGDSHRSNTVAGAVGLLGVFGGQDYVAGMTKLLKDERSCGVRVRNKVRWDIQVRDVAAAWIVKCTKQDLKKYKLESAESWFRSVDKSPSSAISSYSNVVFANEDARKTCLESLTKWLKENPPVELKIEPAPARKIKDPIAKNPNAGKPAKPEPADTDGGEVIADYDLVRQVRIARELIKQGQFEEAIGGVGEILQLKANYVFRPDRGTELFRSLRAEAEGILDDLPLVELKKYEALFGHLARSQYNDALEDRDMQALANVQQQFLYTNAGSKAALLLGAYYRNAGQHHLSSLYLQRVLNRSGADRDMQLAARFELSINYSLQGDAQRASELLVEWKRQFNRPSMTLQGEEVPLFGEDEDPVLWLRRVTGFSDPIKDSWLVWSGDLSGNVPRFESPWPKAHSVGPAVDKIVSSSVDRIWKQVSARRLGTAPTIQPVVVGDLLITRTMTGLSALNRSTGKVVWQVPAENSLTRLLALNSSLLSGRQEKIDAGVRRRMLQDISWGAISSNGRYVFATEDVTFDMGYDYNSVVTQLDGTRSSNFSDYGRENMIAAYELTTGKLIWQLGTGFGTSTSEIAGGRFLGPPVPIDDLLYGVIEFDTGTRLVQINADNGEVKGQWILTTREIVKRTTSAYMLATPNTVARIAPPACRDGVLVCPTLDNRFVAIDIINGAVLWMHRMEAEHKIDPRRINAAMKKSMEDLKANSTDHWLASTAILWRDLALLTTSSGEELHCVELGSGKQKWSVSRHDGLYVGGIENGVAIVVGRASVRGINVEDGTEAWKDVPYPSSAIPLGRGYIGDSTLHVPLSSGEIVRIDVASGRVVSRLQTDSTQPLGNLIPIGNDVFSVSLYGIQRFVPFSVEEKRQIAQLGSQTDAKSIFEMARIDLGRGRLDKGIERLLEARELEQNDARDEILLQSLILLQPRDSQQFLKIADNIDGFLPQRAPNSDWLRFADHLADAGRLPRALDIFESAVEHLDESKSLPASAARTVRSDRLLATKLSNLFERLDEEKRQNWLARFEPFVAEATSSRKVSMFLEHPMSQQKLLKLAADFGAKKEFPQAMACLTPLIGRSDSNVSQEAIESYAKLMEQAKRPWETAFIRARDGDVVAADSPWKSLWNFDSVKKEEKDTKNRNSSHPLRGQLTPMLFDTNDDNPLCEMTFVYDARSLKLFGNDRWSRKRVEVQLPKMEARLSGSLSPYYMAYHIVAVGHTLVGYRGDIVFAVDCSGTEAKLLWHKKLWQSEDIQSGMFNVLAQMRVARMQIRNRNIASAPRSICAGDDYACFHSRDGLVAVEPTTGNVIWTRDDVPMGCDLVGGSEHIVASSLAGEPSFVFRASDGVLLRRAKLPRVYDRVAIVHGTSVFLVDAEAKKKKVTRFNPADGEFLWSREIPAESLVASWRNEIAILSIQGKAEFLDSATGESQLTSEIGDLKNAEHLTLMRFGDKRLLAVDIQEPNKKRSPIFRRAYVGQKFLDGKLFAVNVSDGKKAWEQDVEGQLFNVQQPSLTPIFLMANRFQGAVANGNFGYRYQPPELRVLCLDVRNGDKLYERTQKNWGYMASYLLDMSTEKANTYSLEIYDKTINLEFVTK